MRRGREMSFNVTISEEKRISAPRTARRTMFVFCKAILILRSIKLILHASGMQILFTCPASREKMHLYSFNMYNNCLVRNLLL